MAEKGRRWSPYTYAFDNPIRFIDPDGMWPVWLDDIVRSVTKWWNSPVDLKLATATRDMMNQAFSTSDVPLAETNGEELVQRLGSAAYQTASSMPGRMKIPASTKSIPKMASLGES